MRTSLNHEAPSEVGIYLFMTSSFRRHDRKGGSDFTVQEDLHVVGPLQPFDLFIAIPG